MNSAVNRPEYRCGYVAIVGRPNVGKSTLLNRLLGQKLSITSKKPQTTRHRILGIKTTGAAQIVYVDTPGMHLGGTRAINRYMNRAASSVINDVDIIIFVVEQQKWTDEDEFVLKKIGTQNIPVILLINKVDRVKDKQDLLPYIESIKDKAHFEMVIPMSALHDEAGDILEKNLINLLPVSAAFFPDDQITDRSERFLTAEIIREKLVRNLGQEVPHRVTVEIEQFKLEKRLYRISAIIWVEKPGQKGIIIGNKGERLKTIGQAARIDVEAMLDQKVYLQLWVKVKQGWSDDERALQSLGYLDDV